MAFPETGSIASRVIGLLPVTWDALRQDPRIGEDRLKERIDIVKETLFGEIIADTAESGAYSLRVRDYAAKLAAIEIITAAIDFWMDKSLTIVVDSPKETLTYESRIQTLKDQKASLIAETRAMAPSIAEEVTYIRPSMRGVPGLSTMNTPLVTPDPWTFPRPYADV
jgi:hypothetical protein